MNFNQTCYDLLKQIPKGRVTTYKELARAMGSQAWRAVGTAMAKNPQLVTVPCHRVVKSNGEVGQYAKGSQKKIALLEREGLNIHQNKIQNLSQVLFTFNP